MIKFFIIELFHRDVILINGFFPKEEKLGQANFGDDLNFHLIHLMTQKKVVPTSYSVMWRFFRRESYSCIGSILNDVDSDTIVWGSGAIENKLKDSFCPKKIYAVRGPLTRELVLQKGIECPEVYGDPAMLISCYYTPNVIKEKKKVGFIPHYVDKNNQFLIHYKNDDNVLIIDTQSYGSWRDFIDMIVSCEVIVSSSLHGIIIADTYNVPNVWCRFSDDIVGGEFKYKDYFLSVNKEIPTPLYFDRCFDLDYLLSMKEKWQKPQINVTSLIDSCPFYNTNR
ncbi:polysaccharide pyruvyl transferase family protein [Bacteroides sp. 214]|uniref:polysaccharide pyruvyl transferase family protein n=1 Tax=Bacteroides sp. 214 TaxID=2302935 RepID=UPI0013D4B752|nr:polysaccharide pyruvyl transferase family protein [Bacteroides sp. 214]